MRQALTTLVATVLLAAVGHAQGQGDRRPQSTATFKTDVNLVEVHAVVTDERGAFVRDLTREDFEIYESGKLQKPSVFHLVDVPTVEPGRATAIHASVEPDVRSTSKSFEGRLYILMLDDLHTSALRSQLVKRAARQFVERHLADGDLAAVVHTSGRSSAGQELTPSRQLLLAAVDRFHGQKLPSLTGERLAVHLNDRDLQRAAASGAGDGNSAASPASTRADDPRDAERGMNAQRTLGAIRDVAKWLSDVPGRRKSLVLFSEGIEYDIYDVFNNGAASSIMADARDAIAAAQRANVTIFAVDPRGLSQLGDEAITIQSLSDDPQVDYGTSRGFANELLMAQESLISLAQETGGVAIVRSNDIAGGLSRIERETSRYYVLGYVADPSASPGKFRKVEVKVKKPGLQVRARRGYVPADLKAAEKRDHGLKPGTSPALAAAIMNPVPVGDLPVRVWAAPFKGTGKLGSVAIAVEIDGAALQYQQRDDRFLDDLEVSIVAADHDGKIRGSDRQTLNLKLKPETHKLLMNGGGVRMLSRIEVPAARYQIRVGVHESNGGTVGTVPIDLEVPDFSKLPLGLSGLVITSSAAPRLMTPRPDPLLKDALPLPPVSTRVFGKDEVIAVFTEIYDRSAPASHDVDVTVSVLPRGGTIPVFTATETRAMEASPTIRVHGYKAEIPAKDLAPGDYVLRLEASSRAGKHVAVREVPFTIQALTTRFSN
jgi:VWFA-related protein